MPQDRKPGPERPAAELSSMIRDARLGGAEPAFERSARLLRAVAGDPAEMNALLAGIARSNAAGEAARTLQRHARAASDEIQREIERLSDRENGVLFWGQSIGAATAVGAGVGFAAGSLATGGALAVIAAGAALFAVATRERAASGAEKHRLRRGRDAVRQLSDELAEMAAAFAKSAPRPDI